MSRREKCVVGEPLFDTLMNALKAIKEIEIKDQAVIDVVFENKRQVFGVEE